MFVQVCPKCGTPMNVAFALFKPMERSILLQCPKCHKVDDNESGVVEKLFIPDDDLVETRAGIEGIEARVNI